MSFKFKSEVDEKTLRGIGRNIIRGLKSEKEKGGHPVPDSVLSLGLFLVRHLRNDEVEWLDTLELEQGREACNDWLCTTLQESGYYESDGNGFVKPKN